MVKLFVGNLTEGVDSHRLRNLFLQYDLQVQECDVIKNYAFVHVVSDDDAEKAIQKLNKHKLEGREIHIERSTSRLRKEPGMSDKCFTCGSPDHKTPNCPNEKPKRSGSKRRSDSTFDTVKKPRPMTFGSESNNSRAALTNPVPQCWGYKVGGGTDGDPELPCPQNLELRTLYDQYLESRTRYFFYREQLSKELRHQGSAPLFGGMPTQQTLMPTQQTLVDSGTVVQRIDLTHLTRSAGVPQPQQQQQQQQLLIPKNEPTVYSVLGGAGGGQFMGQQQQQQPQYGAAAGQFTVGGQLGSLQQTQFGGGLYDSRSTALGVVQNTSIPTFTQPQQTNNIYSAQPTAYASNQLTLQQPNVMSHYNTIQTQLQPQQQQKGGIPSLLSGLTAPPQYDSSQSFNSGQHSQSLIHVAGFR